MAKIFSEFLKPFCPACVQPDMSTDASLPQDLKACQRELLAARSTIEHTEAVLAETAVTCEGQQAQLAKLQEELELLKALSVRPPQRAARAGPASGPVVHRPTPTKPPTAAAVRFPRKKSPTAVVRGTAGASSPSICRGKKCWSTCPKSERRCPDCGEPLQKIGEDRSERVDLVPARVWVKVLVRPKYACPRQHGIAQAPRRRRPCRAAALTSAWWRTWSPARSPITCRCIASKTSWPVAAWS